MPSFAKNGHEKREFCPSTFSLKLKESYLKVGGYAPEYVIFITTSNFTKEALDYTPRNKTKTVLIDGELLAQLMIDHNLGCTTQQTYELKKLDNDYFGEE